MAKTLPPPSTRKPDILKTQNSETITRTDLENSHLDSHHFPQNSHQVQIPNNSSDSTKTKLEIEHLNSHQVQIPNNSPDSTKTRQSAENLHSHHSGNFLGGGSSDENILQNTDTVFAIIDSISSKKIFKVGDKVVNSKYPNEVQEIIEIEGNNIRVQHPYGKDWVLAKELELVIEA